MKFKKLVVLGLIAVMTVSFTACGSKKSDTTKDNGSETEATEDAAANDTTEDTTEDTAEDISDLKGTVLITGSTSVEKIILAMVDEFQAINPDVKVNYTGSGSSAGIQDSIDGNNTFAVSSRELKEEESSAGLTPEVFAYDGIAVAVNPANEIKDIKLADLAKIYSGEITNWKDLGGKDGEIVVVSREGASGTRDAFEELTGLEDAGGLAESATVVEGNGNVQATVAGNPSAIGYISFSFIDNTVKALTLDGVESTPENAKSGAYKLSRPFLFAYKTEDLTPEGKAFIEYALSQDGQVFVEENGGIKLK